MIRHKVSYFLSIAVVLVLLFFFPKPILLREDGSEAVSFITHVEESFYMEKLPIGHYILKERSAPDGYCCNDPFVTSTGDKQCQCAACAGYHL